MFDIGAVVAKIKADTTDFKAGMTQAKNGVEDLKSGIGGLGSVIKLAIGALSALAIGATFKELVTAAADAQAEMLKANALIEQAAKNMPKETFQDLREEIDKTSAAFIKLGFDDEDTATAMAKSLLVTKDVTESNKEMALAADFARLRGISIGDAQAALQMAYMGNARVLKQYGIELDDNATKAQIFAKIQAIAGGQADAFSKSYAGSVARFDVEFQNLKETIGTQFLPILTQVFAGLNEFITTLNGADFSAIGNAINTIIPIITTLYWAFQDTFNLIKMWINTNLMPLISGLVEFFRAHWSEIELITTVVFDLIKTIIETVMFLIGGTILGVLNDIITIWNDHGAQLMAGVQGVFEIIYGIIQVALGLIYAVVGFILKAIRGDWDGAWLAVVNGTMLAWNGLKNIFNGILDMIKGFGPLILDSLTKPFRDAWNTIQDLMNKIKDGIDFTKRHSPSVLDIVESGVDKVNKALSGLDYGINITPHAALAPSPIGSAMNQITVSLDGAIIADSASASRMAELIGDGLMKKLKMNVRV